MITCNGNGGDLKSFCPLTYTVVGTITTDPVTAPAVDGVITIPVMSDFVANVQVISGVTVTVANAATTLLHTTDAFDINIMNPCVDP